MAKNSGWYFRRNGEKCGPVDSGELKHMARVGELNLSDELWNESLANWISASRVKGLFPQSLPTGAAQNTSNPNSAFPTSSDCPGSPVSAVLPTTLEDTAQQIDTTAGIPRTTKPVADEPEQQGRFSKGIERSARAEMAQSVKAIGSLPVARTPSRKTAAPSEVRPASNIPIRSTSASEPPQSSPASALRTYLGEELWRQLVSSGLRWDDIVCWVRVKNVSIRETSAGQATHNVAKFLKSVSNKVSSAIEQCNVIDTNRVLVVTKKGPMFVAGQFALTQKVWSLPNNEFRKTVRMSGNLLEIDIHEIQPLREVQQVSVHFDFSTETLPPFGGSIDTLVEGWLKRRAKEFDGQLVKFPMFLSVSDRRRGSFFHPITSSFAGWVSISHNSVRFFNDQFDHVCNFNQIISWREVEHGLECLTSSEDGVGRFYITLHGAVPPQVDSEQASLPPTEPAVTQWLPSGLMPSNVNKDGVTDLDHPGGESLRVLCEAFRNYAFGELNELPVFAAELNVKPVFHENPKSVGITIVGDKAQAWVGDGGFRGRSVDNEFLCYDFPSGRFLQVNGEYFKLKLPSDCVELWKSLCKSTESRIGVGENGVTLATLESDDHPRAVPATLRLDKAGQVHLSRGLNDQCIVSSLRISASSLSWAECHGQVRICEGDDSAAMTLTASPVAIVNLWKHKEFHALQVSIDGVKLGGLYEEFSRRRTDKFLTGVFGSLIVTQEQLEVGGNIVEFLEEINAAPAGPLSDELSARLVQRLSILEVSRQQLGRWFDRCSLFLPHYWSSMEREWLEETFGHEVVEQSVRDREAWRIQQSIRGELRQVQASLGRPLQEIGQNLNAISFAFPEEVRCAALASVRNAAGLAEKGAMLSVFGGIGAQAIMGLGRASAGDPIGIAMLGSLGLSLVGKHLQQKAKDVEQKIRLRAYGCQALQWWGVILESGFVMALECRQSLEQMDRVRYQRDKKLLEGLPREQLPVIQRRMVSAMRKWLDSNINSQFYEVLPGSGLYGHQLVQRIAASTGVEANLLVSRFGYELPGSPNKD